MFETNLKMQQNPGMGQRRGKGNLRLQSKAIWRKWDVEYYGQSLWGDAERSFAPSGVNCRLSPLEVKSMQR